MTEEQQKPVIKITDYYFTEKEIKAALDFWIGENILKDDVGFYYRVETEI